MIGYDDIDAVQYFHENLKAWWKLPAGTTIEKVLQSAYKDYNSVLSKCDVLKQIDLQRCGECGWRNIRQTLHCSIP